MSGKLTKSNMTPILEKWFKQISVRRGEPTRRKIADVWKACSDKGDELRREVQARKSHVIETESHYVLLPTGKADIFC